MDSKEMDKHMSFLRIYAVKNNIIFKINRKGDLCIEEIK